VKINNSRDYGNPSTSKDQNGQASTNEFSKATRLPIEHVKAPGLSLPKGGGAMRSIDEKFSVNSTNGTAGFSIPLPLTSGRGGAAPSLSLQYNTGNGNSVFGLGWSVDFPTIQRKTDKQLPRYDEDLDVYLYSGAEDLVAVTTQLPDGSWVPEERTEGGFRIRKYRPRIEGAFSVIERIQPVNADFIYWKVTTGNNVVTFYGKTAAYRISDPAFPARTFKWLPEFSFDDKGNCTVFEFKAENLDNVTPALHEKNRFNGTALYVNRYLKRVKYANSKAFYPSYVTGSATADVLYNTSLPADISFLFELVFDFGEHAGNLISEDAGVKWPARSDAFSDYRAGFDIRTYRLCKRVMMFHLFNELGATPCLVQSLDLSHEAATDVTYLTAITGRGYIRESGVYRSLAAPPIEFDYETLQWNTTIKTLSPESSVHAPVGLSGNYHWIDLHGEGIAGIFTEEANAWYYKRNEGNGVFSAAVPVSPKPSLLGINNNTLLLQDLEADGQKQVVVNQAGLQGYYQLTDNGEYEPFIAFTEMPDIDMSDPNVKLLDVNGDGQPDLLISEEQAFRWYAAKGKYGYGAPELAAKPFDEEKGPAIVFADNTQSIVLADMSGDGLTDIVRIRNGEICYWPNTGYGKFGAKVTMSRSPVFDSESDFNPAYLRLADINGTGATDICYLGQNRCSIWLNLAGNAWSSVSEIAPFPATAMPGNFSVVDLLGNGTACIVWSSPLPQLSTTPLQYIDLMGGKKPHILSRYRNNRGKEVRMEYSPSTKYYLEDRKAGKPWATRLPFPVQCLRKVEMSDTVSGTCFTTLYQYHHGSYDYNEREFRGFALVETTDTEAYEDYRIHAGTAAGQTAETAFYQPPVTTRTWYHTGIYLQQQKTAHQLQGEYYPAFPQEQLHIADEFPVDLSTSELLEACRSLKGKVLHQEVYSYDGSEQAIHPYSITHHQYQVKLLQHSAGSYAVFLPHEMSTLNFHLERNPEDPRVVHQLNILIDDLGNVKESAAIVYGRKIQDPGLPTNAAREEQSKHHVIYTKNDFTSVIDTPGAYRLPAAYQARTYELNIPLPAKGFYTAGEVKGLFGTAAEKQFQDVLSSGQKKLLAHTRTYFMKNDMSAALPLGEAASLMLPWQSYQLAFTPQLAGYLYGDKVNEALLRNEAGYVQLEGDGNYWISSGRTLQYPDLIGDPFAKTIAPAGPADVLFARSNFYQPVVYEDNRGYLTKVFYDKYKLYTQRSIDAEDNETLVLAYNYRILTPYILKDMNGNRNGIRMDEMGRVTSTFQMGKESETIGDTMDTTKTEAATADQPGSRITYEYRYHTSGGKLPDRTIVQAREEHYYQAPPLLVKTSLWDKIKALFGMGSPDQDLIINANPIWHTIYTYSDGSGHEILTKSQADPGLAPKRDAQGQLEFVNGKLQFQDTGAAFRWAGNGRTIFNNKGNAVKQYEPYYDCTPEYNDEKELVSLGFTPVMYYDAPGRLLYTMFPDGTKTSTVFNTWMQKQYDQNDNVLGSRWYEERIGGQKGEAEKRAAQQTGIHDQTPGVAYQDALGRQFLAVSHNKAQYENDGPVEAAFLYSSTSFDISGNVLSVTDARNNEVTRSRYNMSGMACYEYLMDNGEGWTLSDISGKDIRHWDSRQQVFSYKYDRLHRRIEAKVKDANSEKMYEKVVYGEHSGQPDLIANNLRGKIYRHFDTAGTITFATYDFKGNSLGAVRRLLKEYTTMPDWNANPVLDSGSYEEVVRYDALNRTKLQVLPDGTVIKPAYNISNQLNTVKVNLRGKAQETTFVSKISYDAKGQWEAIYYGNNTVTRYTYQPENYRITRLLTTGNNGTQILQDLQYTYDAVSNITEILDNAQKTVFYGGQKIDARSSYLYDALYQLIQAKGREHIGQLNAGAGDNWDDTWCNLQLQANAPLQLREYQQSFKYDAAGNMLQQRHVAGAGSWTRTFSYNNNSNRLQQTATGNQTFSFQYNEHGSMAQMPHLSLMQWNSKEELSHTGLGGGGDAWYVYDGEGNRVRKIIERPDGTREERIYLGVFEIYRKIKNNTIQLERETVHIMDEQQRIALVETRTKGNEDAPVQLQRYQYNNHLQTACLELDETARIISYEEYHPFGTTAYQAVNKDLKASRKRYRFTGKERDEESGLYYHGARYYAPWLARWTATDPIGTGDGLNIYRYVTNNPVNAHDPTGKWETPSWVKTAAIVTAVVAVAVVVTVATAGIGTAAVGAAVAGAGGIASVGGATVAAVGTVAVAAGSGALGSVAATAMSNELTGGSASLKDAAVAGAVTGVVTLGVGAAVGAGAKGAMTAASSVKVVSAATRAAAATGKAGTALRVAGRAGQGLMAGAGGGATYEGVRQIASGEASNNGGLDWSKIGASAKTGAIAGAVTGPVLGAVAKPLTQGAYAKGYNAGANIRSNILVARAAKTGQNYVIGRHGIVSGRQIATIATPEGVKAAYQRHGSGTANKAGAQAGDWSFFEGFSRGGRPKEFVDSTGKSYPPEKFDPISPGWFVKDKINAGLSQDDPLFKWGTQANKDVATWMGKQPAPKSVQRNWESVQVELKGSGVVTRDPVGGTYHLAGH